jgi:hypothetical protein
MSRNRRHTRAEDAPLSESELAAANLRPKPKVDAPLADEELERECVKAAGEREPVLLVGDETSRPLLERIARRIHDLSNPPGRRYRSISCFGLPPDYVSESSDVVFGIRHFSTIHLGDVESACPALAWIVTNEALDSRGLHARLIASTMTPLGKWPRNPLLDALRECPRIDVCSLGSRQFDLQEARGPSETVEADYIFRRRGSEWHICFNGEALISVPDDGGARAVACLIEAYVNPPYADARYPLGGAEEVAEWMDSDVGRIGARQVSEGADKGNVDRLTEQLDQKRQRLQEIEMESGSPALTDAELTQLQAEDTRLQNEKAEIEAELNRQTDSRGQPRRKRAPGVDKVGSSIRRFLKRIENRCPDLHEHLKEAIKSKQGISPRYNPSTEIAWDVQM